MSAEHGEKSLQESELAAMLDKSILYCDKILDFIASTSSSSNEPMKQSLTSDENSFSTHATVGMILVGTAVSGVVPGGPASVGGVVQGDVIVRVDGLLVNNSTVKEALIGNDQPGSLVTLEVIAGDAMEGRRRTVELRRISSEDLGGKRQMFECFAQLQKRGVTVSAPCAARPRTR